MSASRVCFCILHVYRLVIVDAVALLTVRNHRMAYLHSLVDMARLASYWRQYNLSDLGGA